MTLWVCFGLTAVTLAAGGALTEIGPWYFGLDAPPWKPPNWMFAPIWTVIGVCSAFAANLGWHGATTPFQHRLILGGFVINIVLNIGWSLLFFKLHRPDWALVEVVLLVLSVAALVALLWPIRPLSALLLLPYLLWTAIAATLNWSIVRRNAPFGAARPTPNER